MREIWSRPANKRLPFVFTSTAHKWWAAPQWMSGGFLTILIQMHETKQEGSRALEAKVGGELMAVQMPRQSSFQVDSEQGVGRRACRSGEEGEQGVGRRNHVEWGGGPSGSGEEEPRGVGRRTSTEWGGGPTRSVEDGLSRFAVWSVVTREERFPEQEMFGACFRQCVVDLDLHFIFSSAFWH